jgi:hypothetical protein
MMPGGHLATSLALSGLAYASSGSEALAAGCFAGGFLIDFDHYFDYLVFEKQWRRPGAQDFLRYYFTNSPKRVVLPLHSAELMTALLIVILIHPYPLLVGYWLGAIMHLIFDVLVNGDYALRRPVLFYVFSYRAANRFATDALLDVITPAAAGRSPLREFFSWLPLDEKASVAETDGGLGYPPSGSDPNLELLKVKVDHGRYVEREELRDYESAHHRES